MHDGVEVRRRAGATMERREEEGTAPPAGVPAAEDRHPREAVAVRGGGDPAVGPSQSQGSRVREGKQPACQQGSETVVSVGRDKEARDVPQRPAHVLRDASDQGCAYLHCAEAYVPHRHRLHQGLRRYPDEDGEQGVEEATSSADMRLLRQIMDNNALPHNKNDFCSL